MGVCWEMVDGIGRTSMDSQRAQRKIDKAVYWQISHIKPNLHLGQEVSSLSLHLTAASPGDGKVAKPHYWKVHPVRFPVTAA